MDLFSKINKPILEYLKPIPQEPKEGIMNNENTLREYYTKRGYKNLGNLNFSEKAADAYHQSKDKQSHEIGRCFYLIACHDLKVFFTLDSSD